MGELLGGQSYEVMGKVEDYFTARGNPTEADNGRYNVTHQESDRHRFKVPTLRNVARTMPYFHDGSQATLAEAVNVMARCELGETLTPQDTNDIVKFLETLTGKYKGRPL